MEISLHSLPILDDANELMCEQQLRLELIPLPNICLYVIVKYVRCAFVCSDVNDSWVTCVSVRNGSQIVKDADPLCGDLSTMPSEQTPLEQWIRWRSSWSIDMMPLNWMNFKMRSISMMSSVQWALFQQELSFHIFKLNFIPQEIHYICRCEYNAFRRS